MTKKINKFIIYTFLLLIIYSCSSEKKPCYVCDRSESLEVSDFITKNMKNANNMSDEEMEDVIKELRKTGVILYCKQEFFNYSSNFNIVWEETKRDTSKTYHPYFYY